MSQYYPINEGVFGLSDTQQQVCMISLKKKQGRWKLKLDFDTLQLRKTVFDFVQKELAPLANKIDKENEFAQLRVRVLARRSAL